MSGTTVASWMDLAGTALQLLGSALTFWSLLSAIRNPIHKTIALISALWRSPKAQIAAQLSDLNSDDRSRVLQGVAFLVLGYLLSLAARLWTLLIS